VASDVQIPMQKYKKYEKTGNMTSLEVNNSTIINTNDSGKDEIPEKDSKELSMKLQRTCINT
jgi:hypothetical protein